jgi:hypothetical protein
MNRFIDYLHTPLGTTNNYSATTSLHNPQIVTAPDKSFPVCCVFTSRSLATACNSGDSSTSRVQVLSSQPPVQKTLNWLCPLLTSRHAPRRNTSFPAVTLLLLAHSLPRERVFRTVSQKLSLFTESPLSNGSIRHIVPSLRLFVPNIL